MKTSHFYFYRNPASADLSRTLPDLEAIALWGVLGLTLTALFFTRGVDIAQLLGTTG